MAIFFHESNTTLSRDEPLLAKFTRIDGLGVVLSAGTITCILCALNWGPMVTKCAIIIMNLGLTIFISMAGEMATLLVHLLLLAYHFLCWSLLK